ncbi:hypothetical protein SAMN04488067_111105 [Halorubrum xinjiangense]|uniref:Uncharacterized protein n=1 Tax=Halorubrum xinjiangense TaxID=261291 RepID=A0A1G7QAE5_9EURY|nr:hypothetical protein SAMN04488067_111105 [Halorubrum xinjiangense]
MNHGINVTLDRNLDRLLEGFCKVLTPNIRSILSLPQMGVTDVEDTCSRHYQ